MNSLLVTVLFFTLLVSSHCFETSHHRHRHSKSHPQEYSFDRLMNRLDVKSTPKVPDTTPKPTQKDIFDDFDESKEESKSDPGNSLWDDGTSGVSGTRSPLDIKRWDDILKGNKVEKEKNWEDVKNDAKDEAEEEEEEFDDQFEQSDSYRPWNTNNGESYSSYKWNNMGSRKSVDNLFHDFRSGKLKTDGTKDSAAEFEVYRLAKQMSREAQCRWPRPKVVRVADVYGSTSKYYVPACIVLHQCGDDTGCCSGASQRCGPKITKRVELYFYTTYIVTSHNHQRPTNGIEKLPFYNHTECECVDRLEEVMPRDGSSNAEFRTERNSDQGCKCPSEYTVRRLANGSCSCDCFDKQRDCIKYKRGKEYFNHSDRLCIQMGTCQYPSCDFGVYLRSSGRCPRKHEKFRTWSRFTH